MEHGVETPEEATFARAVRKAVRDGVIDIEGIAKSVSADERRIRNEETARAIYGQERDHEGRVS